MKKFYIISHTHWDREWHKTYQENRIRLMKFMDDLIETLETDHGFKCFTLDGQTSLINDYLEIKPQNKEKLCNLIKSGRIIVGPWYVQPDENLPSGESLIRNLLISKNISDEFGDFMKVGYLPDSFGQSSVMPAILKGFGIDFAVFYRGLASEDTPFNEFLWRSFDGSEVIAVWMPIGYGNGMFLSEDLDKSIQEIENNIKLLDKRSISGDLLLMNGSDQCFPKKFLPGTCNALNEYYQGSGKDYEFTITSLEDYMKELVLYKDKMNVLKGEFRKGKHSRTHISIGATRMDIKKKNFEVERKYQCLLEPLMVLTSLYDKEYEKEIINKGWKYIIENHAHDSICCCCKDIVHSEMLFRIEFANQIADTIIKQKFGKLHSLINYDPKRGKPIIAFSSFLGQRCDISSADIYVKDSNFAIYDSCGEEIDYVINSEDLINLKDTKVSLTPIPDDFYKKLNIDFYSHIDGVGYETYYIREGIAKKDQPKGLLKNNILENNYIKAEVTEDGFIRITDKVNMIEYNSQHVFKEAGNAGDEYDYSPPYDDMVVTSYNCLNSIEEVCNTSLKATLKLEYTLKVPKTTYAKERSKELTNLNITTYMSIYRQDKRIDFKTYIDNNAENHRIQIVFDYGKKTSMHFAGIQLGEIERENESAITAESESSNWSERYYAIYNQHNYCGVKGDNGAGFIIMNKGLPQYQVDNIETTKLCLTLISGVGYMGNENLKYRKGRRSGAFCSTPDSEMLGRFETEYSFMPINEGEDYYSLSERYINPIYTASYAEYEYDGIWPSAMSLIKNSDGLQLSALKIAEDGKGYILRTTNPHPYSKENIELKLNKHIFSNIERVNLAEEIMINEDSVVEKQNNADSSDKAQLSGKLRIKFMNRNAIYSYRLFNK